MCTVNGAPCPIRQPRIAGDGPDIGVGVKNRPLPIRVPSFTGAVRVVRLLEDVPREASGPAGLKE